ncbi:MAG: segregation/condensation protein A, partial [Candidatus Dadabacteria bacterium]|nr:segregation/condensation protein A [Candidatus Dadabacteria bacterium]NIV41626.1 segregation/condensation protein A [Candidatus Dadabacteria bacterium]NIX15968.1 segregation/condensation protein A [Candidatus Dadabacteria bacterium]
METTEILESCTIQVESFEGPLDLLLHLIKKHEIDIYDIPIAMISEQYNQYLDIMKELDLDIVGDYLKMAAELGYIKSRMLLPKPEAAEED